MTWLVQRLGGIDDLDTITYAEWELRHSWPPVVLLLLIVAGIAFCAWSYASRTDRATWVRAVMGTCRAAAITLMLLILFEPVLKLEFTQKIGHSLLVLLDTSESMSIADPRSEAKDAVEAAMALGLAPLVESNDAPERAATAPTTPRLDLARAILTNSTWGLRTQLQEEYALRTFAFDDETRAVRSDANDGTVGELKPTGPATALGVALEQALQEQSGRQLAGIVVLSDFAWNHGKDPMAVADRLQQRGVPIYPIPVGVPAPPDVRLTSLYAAETAFVNDKYAVKVQIHSTREFVDRGGVVELVMGEHRESRVVAFNGGHQVEEFKFRTPSTAGDVELKVRVKAMDEEAVIDNNVRSRDIHITDEKIKVLYVESLPRWEYRFLRWVLLRDPRLEVKFLLTEGDPDLASYSKEYLFRFPEAGVAGLDFDIVILGDVAATFFTAQQISWLESLVKRRGGSLLMVGGKSHAPRTYVGTPMADILPVRADDAEWEPVGKRDTPVMTTEGIASQVLTLTDDPAQSVDVWRTLRPLGRLPIVRPKPGATTLMTVSGQVVDGEPYPLIAWQRVGSGKTMFIGTEKLWRMRYEIGRIYHERFWAQSIQFLAMSRLLGANRRVNLQTDKESYNSGERVEVFANVLDKLLEPLRADRYPVTVEAADGSEEPRPVLLRPVVGVPGFFSGYLLAAGDGRYTVRAPATDRELANEPTFTVRRVSLEMQEPAMRADIARQLATRSEGYAAMSLRDMPGLVEHVRRRAAARIERAEIEIWDTPAMFLLVMIAAGIEWLLRRKVRLV